MKIIMPSLNTRSTVRLTLCSAALFVGGLGVRTPEPHIPLSVENLPLIGSAGGNSFTRDCPANHVLTGVRWRRGVVLDAIGIKCRPVRSDGTLGTEISSGTMAGGSGGTFGSESCPGSVIVSQVGASQAGVGIGTLVLGCYQWFPASRSWGGSQQYPVIPKSGGVLPALVKSTCSRGTQPATGIRGRYGLFVDAFGLRGNAP